MDRSLKEFHKWCVVEEAKSRYFHSRAEYETAKGGWIAALEYIKRELYEVRAHGFEPDMGLSNLLKRELEGADK